MKTNLLFVFPLWLVVCTPALLAKEPAKSNAAPEEELNAEATEIVSELRAQFAADSEAIAMLDAILNGSRLGPTEGWFQLSKSRSRFDWESVLAKFDRNEDQQIEAGEFTGSREDFARIDRNSDDRISESDFDWSEHSLAPTPGSIMFFRADHDANGKLTKEEFAGLYEQLADSQDQFLALDDLREQFLPPPAEKRELRADKPSRNTLIAGLKKQEIGSLQPGPEVGTPAPDFTLPALAGQNVTLHEEVGEKPIVLVFGNFTCGPFRSQAGNLEKLYERYQDRAKFYLIYVREAHPSDGWWMLSNQHAGIDLAQPTSHMERKAVASKCQQHLDLEMPFLVDDVDDRVGTIYSGMPNRLYLLDLQGKVVFKNARGPFGFHTRQLEQALVLLLNTERANVGSQTVDH